MAFSNITITANTGLSFIAGQYVQVIHDVNNYFVGQIVSLCSKPPYCPVFLSGQLQTAWRSHPPIRSQKTGLYQVLQYRELPIVKPGM